MNTNDILKDIFPVILPSNLSSTPVCGPDGCAFASAVDIYINGINPGALNAAKTSLFSSFENSLSATLKDFSLIASNLIKLVAINIYIPILMICIVIIWLMVAARVFTWEAALILTIALIMVFIIFFITLSSSIKAYLETQKTAIKNEIISFVEGGTLLNALNDAACAYNEYVKTHPAALIIQSNSCCGKESNITFRNTSVSKGDVLIAGDQNITSNQNIIATKENIVNILKQDNISLIDESIFNSKNTFEVASDSKSTFFSEKDKSVIANSILSYYEIFPTIG